VGARRRGGGTAWTKAARWRRWAERKATVVPEGTGGGAGLSGPDLGPAGRRLVERAARSGGSVFVAASKEAMVQAASAGGFSGRM
jgi:hypothetical protein